MFAMPLSGLLVESPVRSPGTLLVGDPAVLARAPLAAGGDVPFAPLAADAGLAAALRPPDPAATALVWVGGTPRAVQRVVVSFRLDTPRWRPVFLGHVDCPSGRLVVGGAEAVAAWGDDAEPDHGLAAQARAFRPGRRYGGLVVVARVPAGPHPVLGLAGPAGNGGDGGAGRLDGFVVDVVAHDPALRLAG